ncbi:GNAT family N-acetyltransferase [Leptotrichia sp. oral taxon 212]|jgi:acetyltransferases|uniref:GNAT family N-acetyltransferase n=1 Tax=Leptotrichia sp. oral taxon 212 TaxID=712357 RepID=UPI000B191BF5|nr:GNAT family N-acetyltransferase [Leptotrichia sp. oral taxon 212]
MGISIRRAIISDIPGLNELLHQVHKVHADKRPDLFKEGKKKYNEEELKKIINNYREPVFVAVDEKKNLLGHVFCIFKENKKESLADIVTLFVDDLCVSEKARGKGIGAKLYEYVVNFALKNGCYNVTLDVWSCNEQAIKFYEKCGMKVQKVIMEKILN